MMIMEHCNIKIPNIDSIKISVTKKVNSCSYHFMRHFGISVDSSEQFSQNLSIEYNLEGNKTILVDNVEDLIVRMSRIILMRLERSDDITETIIFAIYGSKAPGQSRHFGIRFEAFLTEDK